jgi:serine/threonine protein kinase
MSRLVVLEWFKPFFILQDSETQLELIMEYCDMGDLASFIKRYPLSSPSVLKGLPEGLVRSFTNQLASALYCLYENSLIHRDLKPQNILLSKNKDVSAIHYSNTLLQPSMDMSLIAALVYIFWKYCVLVRKISFNVVCLTLMIVARAVVETCWFWLCSSSWKRTDGWYPLWFAFVYGSGDS